MNRTSGPIQSGTRHPAVRIFGAVLTGVLVLLSLLGPRHVSAQEFGAPEPGRRVYDEAGIFTPTEVQYLEEAAARTTAAGSSTIVYIRSADRTGDETEQDAADLMEEWDVESFAGANDGLVLFFNSNPDEPRHGQFAFYAGERHFDGGNLPQRELERIIDDVMTQPIRDDKPAVGLAAGLDAAAQSLAFGPGPAPEPSELEEAANTLAVWPLGILGGIASLATVYWGWRRWQARPGADATKAPATTELPDRLPPAIAGALVTGSAGVAQAQATVLDLAARGAISFEPAERGAKKNQKLQILLVDDSLLRTDYEREVWRALATVADTSGVITAKQLPKLQNAWKSANATLRRGMEERGWWDPDIGRHRRPFFIVGAIALAAALVTLAVAVIGEQPLGAIAVVALGGASLIVFLLGGTYPATTGAGAAAAAPWLGFQAGLKRLKGSGQHVDYDTLLPYIMAMNQFGALDKDIKAASADGYVPLAFRHSLQGDAWTGGFYPYFIFFTASSGPSSSAATGASASGAAAGGGGASGSA